MCLPLYTVSFRMARTEPSLPLSVSLAPGTVPSIMQILNKNVLKEGDKEIRREKGNKARRDGIENRFGSCFGRSLTV